MAQRLSLWFFFLMALIFTARSQALSAKWVEKVSAKIEKKIENSKVRRANLGIYIADGEDEPVVVYKLNDKEKMIPASITKIATSAGVLSVLPPGSKFKTQLLSGALIEEGKLKGDLILKGGGDPSFTSESMWFLVNAFLRSGIKVIEGDIVVDDTFFDQLRIDPSREKVRVDRAYDAPTGAMSFNWNSVNVFVRPGAEEGSPARVFTDPENDYIQLKASVKTTKVGGKTEISVERGSDSKAEGDTIVVTGKIAKDAVEHVIYKNITSPDLWSGANLKSFLAQRGVMVKGRVRAGRSAAAAQVLAEGESKPIEQIMTDMNKFSNNYVAEMLTKNISAKMNPPGTINKSMESIRQFLLHIGLNESEFHLNNPSGLTRDNRMTAQGLWKVLHYMNDQFQYQPEFVTSLPIAGVDGTLKKRMKGTVAERWVRAKTGLLTGVVSLAGYAGRHDGAVLPFVMMYNGHEEPAVLWALYDQILTLLVE